MASASTGSVEELRNKWEKATGTFQQLISEFGTDEIEELDRLHQQAAELDAQVGQAEVRLTTLLGGCQFDALLADRGQRRQGFPLQSPCLPLDNLRKTAALGRKHLVPMQPNDRRRQFIGPCREAFRVRKSP